MKWIALSLMTSVLSMSSAHAAPRPFHLHCTLDGKPMAEWRERAGQYRIKLDGEWSDVSADAAGPMMLLLWAGGAKCARR